MPSKAARARKRSRNYRCSENGLIKELLNTSYMAQKLILFEDILNGAAIKSNKTLMAELGKLAEYVFGESGFSIEKAEKKADDIQIWSGDELYKALANDYGTAFRFKSAFVIEADGYVGPVMAWFFEPDGAFDDQIVVLTCESNGLFKNPRYVCGLLISEYDLDRLLGEFGDDHDDEDDKEWDEDEEDKEEINDDKLKSSVLQAISEIKEKEEATDKGDLILKLVSYEGSIIKMMTVLSSIEGIDEEAAFNILQKMPSVIREGISAKAAMKIGAILEDAGATVELAKASAKASDPVVKTKSPKPKPEKHKSSPKPKSAPKSKPAEPKLSPEEYVDLGLSVKWARCNLGATAPEETGDYFAWGEVAPKSCYDWATYELCKEEKYNLIKYCTKSSYGKADNLKKLESEDDAATASLGKLRTPTIEEWQELSRECTWTWTDVNGKKGYLVTGSTGNSIFLPAAGWKESDESQCMDAVARYWSSSLDTDSPWKAKALFESNNPLLKLGCYDDRCWGFSIRPVTK